MGQELFTIQALSLTKCGAHATAVVRALPTEINVVDVRNTVQFNFYYVWPLMFGMEAN